MNGTAAALLATAQITIFIGVVIWKAIATVGTMEMIAVVVVVLGIAPAITTTGAAIVDALFWDLLLWLRPFLLGASSDELYVCSDGDSGKDEWDHLLCPLLR